MKVGCLVFGPLCGLVCGGGVGFPSTALVVFVFCVLPLLRCVRFVFCLPIAGRRATWHFCTKWSNDRHLLHLEERPLYSREYSISPSLSSLGIMMEWGRASTLLVRMRTLGPDSLTGCPGPVYDILRPPVKQLDEEGFPQLPVCVCLSSMLAFRLSGRRLATGEVSPVVGPWDSCGCTSYH
uniref:Uncharacterized protein n=1 Tax=Physcomitrium patens TaxID=3218 RepID=A0A2K1IDZ1_PHYPA|nr:hypothetical protein PHYPA_029651 [Physcomitrium patens]